MRHNLKFTKYHVGVVVLYVVLLPFFIQFLRGAPRYYFGQERLGLVATITLFTLIAFFGFLGMKFGKPKLTLNRVWWGALYGMVFAFPEEIIFRGIIQGFLEDRFVGILMPILVSSLIFGVAHLPNSVKNFKPRGWNWKLAGLTFLAGLPLGAIFVLTDSLLIPTILHALFVMSLQLFAKDPESQSVASKGGEEGSRLP